MNINVDCAARSALEIVQSYAPSLASNKWLICRLCNADRRLHCNNYYETFRCHKNCNCTIACRANNQRWASDANLAEPTRSETQEQPAITIKIIWFWLCMKLSRKAVCLCVSRLEAFSMQANLTKKKKDFHYAQLYFYRVAIKTGKSGCVKVVIKEENFSTLRNWSDQYDWI